MFSEADTDGSGESSLQQLSCTQTNDSNAQHIGMHSTLEMLH